MRAAVALALLSLAVLAAAPRDARAQAIDLSQGGSITVTSLDGINWDQKAQTVTAVGQARAVRGDVTVDADRLIAFYRKKAPPPGSPAPAPSPPPAAGLAAPGGGSPDETGDNEIYRLEAIGHVHIYTATDQAWGDQALYDIDQSVLVLTGHDLRLVTPTDTVTARDSLEYWPQKRMSVARGNAVLVTSDARRIAADVLVGFSAPSSAPPANGASHPPPGVQPVSAAAVPPRTGAGGGKPQDPLAASSGKLQRAEAYGDVVIRTPTETVRGQRGVYVAATGIARVLGDVHITRGENQLDGQAAIVNMRTGIATLTNDPGERVQGLIVPNSDSNGSGTKAGPETASPARRNGA